MTESAKSMENMATAQNVQAVIERIERVYTERERVFVAIDGPCTSGKTTLATVLQRRFGGNVLHMDDFFLRPEQRTPERFAEPGGNVDRERFEDEVLAPLAAGKIAQYRPWDCHTGDFAASRNVEPARLTIVEGSYSMHPALRGYYDLMICLTIDSGEQLRRLEARNPRMLQRFIDEWIPLENRYFASTETRTAADMIVDTAASE
ncbi:phosphoribulokinase [Bifidobacterium pseudocatenulatum]|uniref:uridine kinase family protein n=1 Tax=Bifidobacterium pseudocatenulatum TaxID=28026 RepID=UPI002330009A|nr:phosphoribulokinase [Bifidobacterium pseudocatenulatum]MDB6508284.1 phosphoribulokinase [Bifidobacterium pseudocatenulatum]